MGSLPTAVPLVSGRARMWPWPRVACYLTRTPAAQTTANANENQLSLSKFKNFSSEQNLVPVYCHVINQNVTIQTNR